jgi:3-isopropylmalate dehydratase small subunit
MGLTVVESRAYPLGRANVDTDMIVSAEWLKVTTRKGLGQAVFAALRGDRANVFDDAVYAGARILIAGENFGCGSSREHAAWAMADMGIAVVIAQSFSDIFAANAFKNGILTVALPAADVAVLLDIAKVGKVIRVDLERCRVEADGRIAYDFAIDPFHRRCLIEGLDEIALTQADAPHIAEHERRIAADAPWLAEVGASV